MPSLRAALIGAVSGLVLCGAAFGDPVTFTVTPSSFEPGTGYGTSLGSLNVAFDATGSTSSFVLTNAGDASTFNFGTIELVEPLFIGAHETDSLGVAATFEFLDPLAGLKTVTAIGSAVFGFVNDAAVDLTIDWAPIVVGFGSGGSFEIDMNTLSFTSGGQTLAQNATITLLSSPVPEPATLALVSVALVGLAWSRRLQRS